jgi:hypothetical protein
VSTGLTAANHYKLTDNHPAVSGGWNRVDDANRRKPLQANGQQSRGLGELQYSLNKVMSAAVLLHKVVRSVRLASALHTACLLPAVVLSRTLVHTFQTPSARHPPRLRSQMFGAVVRIFRVPERGKSNKVMSVAGLLSQST